MVNTGDASVPSEVFASLEKAFQNFQERSEKLSGAYAAMQEDFRRLNVELDRKNRELGASLEKQEEVRTYLNSILESMGNGVVAVDISGKITLFNAAAAQITGRDVDDVIGREYRDVFAKEADEKSSILRVLETGGGHERNEKVVWHREGYPVPVSFQNAYLKDHTGRDLGAVEIFADISKIKALEDEMQQTRTMAALGEMSATVAHEIRNPLGAMGVWAGLLDRDFDTNDPRRATLKKIIDGLARMNKIVSNLLVYSRPVNACFRTVVLQELLRETVNYIEIEGERMGRATTIRKSWDGSPDVLVKGDPEKLQQVIMNLCLNAIQAMPDGGTLRVGMDEKAHGNPEYACFRISDTGAGIEPDRIEKIFDPFHTTKENGTGLGLAIVKKFVDHHSGYVRVESSVGSGTTVSVFLPRARQ